MDSWDQDPVSLSLSTNPETAGAMLTVVLVAGSISVCGLIVEDHSDYPLREDEDRSHGRDGHGRFRNPLFSAICKAVTIRKKDSFLGGISTLE
jgi:hypothetical protein